MGTASSHFLWLWLSLRDRLWRIGQQTIIWPMISNRCAKTPRQGNTFWMSSTALVRNIKYVKNCLLFHVVTSSCVMLIHMTYKTLTLLQLRGFEMLKAVYLEPNPFDMERDLITPTFKLKRPQLLKYYKVKFIVSFSVNCLNLVLVPLLIIS